MTFQVWCFELRVPGNSRTEMLVVSCAARALRIGNCVGLRTDLLQRGTHLPCKHRLLLRRGHICCVDALIGSIRGNFGKSLANGWLIVRAEARDASN